MAERPSRRRSSNSGRRSSTNRAELVLLTYDVFCSLTPVDPGVLSEECPKLCLFVSVICYGRGRDTYWSYGWQTVRFLSIFPSDRREIMVSVDCIDRVPLSVEWNETQKAGVIQW